MKRNLLLKTLLLLFALIAGSSSTWADTWEETALADLTSTDVFVIVGDNGTAYAMSNDKGTANPPAAVAVTIADGKITSTVTDDIKWNISGNATDGYTLYPDGDSETWLYCTNSNNGVRVGTNASKTFKIDSESGYLKHDGTSRYVGIYNSQDWRCYTSINANIKNQSFKFYKKVAGGSETPKCVAPNFSPAAGAVVSGTKVTIETKTEGATIYYTMGTDPADPDESSTKYTAPIEITAATTIKAYAVKAGYNKSDIVSATYTIAAPLANIAALTAKTETGTYAVTLTNAVVTFASGNYAYIQDASGAVAMYKSEHGLKAGDVLTGTATVAYQLRNKNPQITDL